MRGIGFVRERHVAADCVVQTRRRFERNVCTETGFDKLDDVRTRWKVADRKAAGSYLRSLIVEGKSCDKIGKSIGKRQLKIRGQIVAYRRRNILYTGCF